MIRSATQNQKSLDDVMHVLYHNHAMKGLGYSGDDFKGVCESIAERSFDVFFSEIVHTANTLLIGVESFRISKLFRKFNWI